MWGDGSGDAARECKCQDDLQWNEPLEPAPALSNQINSRASIPLPWWFAFPSPRGLIVDGMQVQRRLQVQGEI